MTKQKGNSEPPSNLELELAQFCAGKSLKHKKDIIKQITRLIDLMDTENVKSTSIMSYMIELSHVNSDKISQERLDEARNIIFSLNKYIKSAKDQDKQEKLVRAKQKRKIMKEKCEQAEKQYGPMAEEYRRAKQELRLAQEQHDSAWADYENINIKSKGDKSNGAKKTDK